MIFSNLFKFIGYFIPVKERKVFFTGNSQGYNDSPMVIYEAMKKDNRFEGIEFVWAVKPESMPKIKDDKVIKFNSFSYFIEALSSEVWVASVNVEPGLQF